MSQQNRHARADLGALEDQEVDHFHQDDIQDLPDDQEADLALGLKGSKLCQLMWEQRFLIFFDEIRV